LKRNRTLIGVAAVLALAAVGAFLLIRTEPQTLQSAQTGATVAMPPDATATNEPAATSEPVQAEAQAPAMSEAPVSEAEAPTVPAPAQVAAIPKAAEAEATPESQPAAPQAAPQVGAVLPSFDIVRVEPSGETVIAGRAAPGSEVILRDGNRILGTTVANGRGQWVLVLEIPLEPGSHELSLESRLPGGPTLVSENVVVVSVPRPQIATAKPGAPTQPEAIPQPVIMAQEAPGQPAPGVGADQAASPAPTTEAAPAAPAAPTSQDPVAAQDTQVATAESAAEAQGETVLVAEAERPLVVLMPRDGGGQIRILQQTESVSGGLGEGTLVLETVDYDDQGRAQVGGRAPAESRLVVYLDNKPAADTEAALDGHWEVTLTGSIAPGLHSLRVDQLTDDGQVAARVETPFSRAAVLDPLPGESRVVVQPGNSLWRISRRLYGKGVRNSVIYQANKDQIRDPDLIYPGQIFLVPSTN
jgi:nucleoid-associated protein YgaU